MPDNNNKSEIGSQALHMFDRQISESKKTSSLISDNSYSKDNLK